MPVLASAIELEKNSSWWDAANAYGSVLDRMTARDSQLVAVILERKAYALHRSALQADTSEQFEERSRAAIEAYANAKQKYAEMGASTAGWQCRCDAMTSYVRYWLATNAPEKKEHMNSSWKDAKAALGIFESSGRTLDFALTFNQLSYAAAISYDYDGEAESREKILRESVSYAQKSIRYLAAPRNREDLARAHAKAAGLLVAIEVDFASYREKDEVDLDALGHWTKATEISEEAALSEIPFVVILQSWPAALTSEERTAIYEKGREVIEKTRDCFSIGCLLDGLAQRKFLLAMAADDTAMMESLSSEGFETAKAARENLEKVRFVSPNVICVWIHAPEAGYYATVASEMRDPELKREMIYKAQHPCIEQLKLAEESGYPDVRTAGFYMLGTVLKELGKNEAAIDMKRSYLENAVEKLTIAIDQDRKIHPTEFLPQGLDLLSLAEAHYEIAQITTNVKRKTAILRDAVQRKREALGYCEKELNATQDINPEISSEIAEGYHTTGNWAKAICTLEGDNSCLSLVVECLERAVSWYSRAGLSSQSAETNWEIAQTYDRLAEFLKSSERFELAADDYRKAAESILRLDEFYADHAIYMRAWGQIERARYHHSRQEPDQARECYETASAMHRSSRRWSYMAMNYSALAKIEHAEELSRSERVDESIKAFEDAAQLLQQSKKSLHEQILRIEDFAEKQSARDLERATDSRSNYCKARVVLELAGKLDKQGDVSASAVKYGQAADMLDKIITELDTEQDKKEIQLVATLSRAWQAMSFAEAETSPDQYDMASQLFDDAKDLSLGEKSKLLMAGHSRFCRALGVGARFVDSGDINLHAEATKNLESAADYYLKAEHPKESDYAKASKLLFDAYVHMGRASREEDQATKAKLYSMAEKVLQTSASAFKKAEEPKKQEQVQRLLKKVAEDRELALSLTEVLHAPDAASKTTIFPSPTPSHESATGRERFEHADIHVALIAYPKHVHVGQDVEIVVEMTNAGKGGAVLRRVTDAFPKGFKIKTKPDIYGLEGNRLDLRGKRLEALSSEVIKLVITASSKGNFVLRPCIHFENESGVARDQKTEPIEVTVRELGLSGWLKGT